MTLQLTYGLIAAVLGAGVLFEAIRCEPVRGMGDLAWVLGLSLVLGALWPLTVALSFLAYCHACMTEGSRE